MTEGERPERSSDDLIREAREGLERRDASASKPGAGDAAAEAGAMSTEPPPGVTVPDSPAESQPDPEVTNEPVEAFEPTPPPSPAPPPTPTPAPPPPAPGVRSWLIIAAVLVIGVAVLVVFALRSDSSSIASIDAGDCFQDPGLGEISRFVTTDCDDPHDFESIGRITLPVGPYPGDDEVILAAIEECLTLFEPYVGAAFTDSALFVDAFVPTRDSWEADDRDAICIVFEADDGFDPIPITGSVRNSG